MCSGFSVKEIFLTNVPRLAVKLAPFTTRSLIRVTESPSFKAVPLLSIVGFILVLFALVPGLPTLSLGFVGGIFLFMGYMIYKSKDDPVKSIEVEASGDTAVGEQPTTDTPAPEDEEKTLEDILKQDILELDLGYQLIRLADPAMHGDLLDRIKTTRRKTASDFGFLVPQIRIRDNLHLPPNNYQLLLKGVEIGHGEIYPDKFLAMDSGLATGDIDGIKTKEPAFGLDAVWIEPMLKEEAITQGYTVVDPSTVISTHIGELIKNHLSRELHKLSQFDVVISAL